ncbi:MAG TPA: SGNH/GDSL hydrolase family protein [Nocardioides sp.]|nr:SGNH/GDSL hydrolase family protein [Nocardioides sp.]
MKVDRTLLAVAGGAVLGAAAVAAGGRLLLTQQARHARRLIGKPWGELAGAPESDRVYKKSLGRRVELVVMGDSIAAGLGAQDEDKTLGARLARGVVKKGRRSVRLTTVARVGSESRDLAAQLDALPPTLVPDVTVVVVGGNDVTHRVPVAESVRRLEACIDALHHRGSAVVVGTCPDLGALRPVPQPLRSLGARASRQLATAQRRAALARGAWVVSLAHVVGPFFITNPDEMFSLDRFHPSDKGYKRTAKAMLPSVLAALGVRDDVPFGHHAPGVPAGHQASGEPPAAASLGSWTTPTRSS